MHMRMVQESVGCRRSLHHLVLIAVLFVVFQDLSSRGGAQAWTYNYSISTNRRWPEARQWCQQHFTDMVFIRSKEENDYLNNMLPFHSKYYWIGIKKEGGEWVWAQSNKTIPQEVQNWAHNEPDTIPAQDCVEMYVKREVDSGMWDNERCSKKKGTLCYMVSCKQDSCSEHADCVETVGNFTCKCHPGFTGSRCQEAISCKPLLNPEHGSHFCIDPYGSSRFNSSCSFQCELGYQLVGVPQLLCQASGQWIHPVPLCQVKQCPALNTSISAGSLNCSHPIAPYSYNSTCEVTCNEGYELKGQDRIRCEHTGKWTASIPACTVKTCSPILFPVTGSMTCVDTLGPFSFGSQCSFTCKEGYNVSGDDTLTCLASGKWSKPSPTCTVVKCSSLKAPPQASMQCQDPLGAFSFGSVCIVKCEEGFDLIGSNMTKCSSKGNWRNKLPVCRAKTCPTLSSPTHGSLSCSDPHGKFRFGSLCTSTCQEGFVLNGTADTKCNSLGMWSNKMPSCYARPCPLLAKALQHGRMNCSHPHSSFSFDTVCDFECDEGFRLRGEQSLICNQSGYWSQDLPTCQPVQCGAIHALSVILSMNCSHPLRDNSFGSQCHFKCKEGFGLNGTEVLFCSSSGFWNDSLPNCIVEGMPVGTALLMYAGVGAASVVIPLVLIGLAFLIIMKYRERDNPILTDTPAWGARENPVFEF
ncbi:P-selectin [Cheilinus undulatus]|uniref:P-selectin n=1 Tax=Cheilinus undulatus TaxID=241271 RepID=UPI001BD423B3|nr:P-selectin [Cheilinus undulatus]